MMNAKSRLVCRVAGILLLAIGVVKIAMEAVHTASFERLPSGGGFYGSGHLSGSGLVALAIGGFLLYFGLRTPREPTR